MPVIGSGDIEIPLNGAGLAAKPAGTTATANSTIESSKFNSVIDDIYSIFNTVRPIAYGGTGGATEAASRIALGVAAATQFNAPINVGLVASVGASALTIALKGADGNDPSATNPVFIPFRNVTIATGTPTVLTAVAAASLVIPSTATMGFTNAVAARLWIVAFNDAGTVRLGAINCLSGVNIYPLAGMGIASSTTVSTGADNAHVFYSGTGVTAKAYAVLGYMDFSLTTAGTWDEVPDAIRLFGPGVPLPGTVIQPVRTDTGAVATGTTTIPFDDSIPQNTEGTEFMTQAITPISAANLLRVNANGMLGTNTAGAVLAAALFQDSVADAKKAIWAFNNSSTSSQTPLALTHVAQALSVSATTFKFRAGAAAAATVTFNGAAGARIYGGVLNSFMEIEEIMA